jgi:hypothetical protein
VLPDTAVAGFNANLLAADNHQVSGTARRGRPFLWLAIGISVLLTAGWVAWIAFQPPCGPPGNTPLAATDRWVPWAFIAIEFVSVTMVGVLLKSRWMTVLCTVVCVGAVAIVCGGLIDFVIAAQAGCFA